MRGALGLSFPRRRESRMVACVPLRVFVSTWLARRRRDSAPAGGSLSFVAPNESNQSKGALHSSQLRGHRTRLVSAMLVTSRTSAAISSPHASLRIGLGCAHGGVRLRYLSPNGRSVFVGLCTPSVSHTPPPVLCTPPLPYTPPPVRAEVSKPRSNASTPPSRCEASRVWCLTPPSDELSSTGLCGSARKRASTSDFGQLLERSGKRPRSEFCPTRKDRAAQGSPCAARAESAGSLLCLLSCRHKKVGRLPGRIPGAASRSEQDFQRESGTRLRYLSPNGWWHAEPSWIPAYAGMTGISTRLRRASASPATRHQSASPQGRRPTTPKGQAS
jgi:hypothetical protein